VRQRVAALQTLFGKKRDCKGQRKYGLMGNCHALITGKKPTKTEGNEERRSPLLDQEKDTQKVEWKGRLVLGN